MKIAIIPPARGMNFTPQKGQYLVVELIDRMRKAGQLDGVDVDLDEGYPFPVEELGRAGVGDEEAFTHISVGLIRKVKEYSKMGKYDAIVTTGDLDPGFFATRFVSSIPVVSVGHASLHVASLIGERCTFFAVSDGCALIFRHMAQLYGLGQKLISVRHPSVGSTYLARFIREHEKAERMKVPEVRDIVQRLKNQCISAIKEDRVDSIIFGCSAVQLYRDEVRQALDEAGYSGIPIVMGLSSAVEMAKALVNMKLTHSARAYPGEESETSPAFR